MLCTLYVATQLVECAWTPTPCAALRHSAVSTATENMLMIKLRLFVDVFHPEYISEARRSVYYDIHT